MSYQVGLNRVGRDTYIGLSSSQALYGDYESPGAIGSSYARFSFKAPVSQTSGNLTVYAYCGAWPFFSGSVQFDPSEVSCWLYEGESATFEPHTPYIARADSSDGPFTGLRWVSFCFTGITLTADRRYFLDVGTRHTLTADTYRRVMLRSSISSWNETPYDVECWWSSEPTEAAMILQLDGGTAMGCPWVGMESRELQQGVAFGMRYAFEEKVRCRGVVLPDADALDLCSWYDDLDKQRGGLSHVEVWRGGERIRQWPVSGPLPAVCAFPDAVVFPKGIDMRVMFRVATGRSVRLHLGTMGDLVSTTYSYSGEEPAWAGQAATDVGGMRWCYVQDGVLAEDRLLAVGLLVDQWLRRPAVIREAVNLGEQL